MTIFNLNNKIDSIKCQDNYKIIFVIDHVYRRLLDWGGWYV